MASLINRLFSRLHPVHRAGTPEERAAIYRFRYSVQVVELERETAGADQQKKEVRDEDDEAPGTTHLYLGSPEEVTATLRVRQFAPGQAPSRFADDYSLDLIPGVNELAVSEVGRFLVRPSLGEQGLLPSLAAGCWELLGEKGVDLVFMAARPSLVSVYQGLGARLFGGRLMSRADGLEVPMLLIASDEEHLRKSGSPAAGFSQKYFGPGKRAPVNTKPFEPLFASAQGSVVTDPAVVSGEFQKALMGGRQPPVFLQSLDESTIKRLAAQGFILGVPKDAVVAREGRAEREMFAILEGSYEVSIRNKQVNVLGRGDLFGEVAYFTYSGRRSATVRALTPGRLVVLRKRFLEELAKKDPKAAIAILHNLARILAERLERIMPGR